jgi:hypothetical protein
MLSKENDMDVAKLVEVYIKIRDKRAEIKTAYEAEDAKMLAKLDLIEAEILEVCKENDVESLRTTAGTATRTVKERVWASDWDSFYGFVREHDAVELLEKRIHQGNYKEWADSHPDVIAPVNVDRKYAITVRRSKD